jgi:hypothetical protein
MISTLARLHLLYLQRLVLGLQYQHLVLLSLTRVNHLDTRVIRQTDLTLQHQLIDPLSDRLLMDQKELIRFSQICNPEVSDLRTRDNRDLNLPTLQPSNPPTFRVLLMLLQLSLVS